MSLLRIATSGGDVFREEYSLAFDGTNEYVDCGVTGLPVGDAVRTIMVWVYKSATDDQGIFGWGKKADSSAGETFEFYSANAGNVYAHFATHTSGSSTALQLNTWTHLCATYDSADLTSFYINGVLNHSSTRALITVATMCRIGCQTFEGTASDFFTGKISDIAVYSSALSASQVATIYNGREPYNHKEGIASGTLVSWFRMGDGTLDKFALIGDEVNPTFGADIVEANTADLGSFNTDTTGSWTPNNAIAHNSGTGDATVTHDGSGYWIMAKASLLTIGTVYKATFKAKATGDTNYLALTNGSGVTHTYVATLNPALSTSYQNYEFLFKAVHATFEFSSSNSATSYSGATPDNEDTFTFDDIVVLPASGNAGFMINMAADDFTGDTP